VAPTEDGKRKAETKKINDKQEAEKARKSERESSSYVLWVLTLLPYGAPSRSDDEHGAATNE